MSKEYTHEAAELEASAQLARWLAAQGGETPLISTGAVRQLAWARRTADTLYLFVVNDGDAATVSVRLRDLTALGLEAARAYAVRDAMLDAPLPSAAGAALRDTGLAVPLPRWGTAVLTLRAQ